MKIEVVDVLPFPRGIVFRTLRDELSALVQYLPNIDGIEQREREDLDGGRVRILNRWKARSDIPAVARAFVKPEMLEWLDHSTWDPGTWSCAWRLEMGFFTDRIRCAGLNEYVELGPDRTELAVRGDLTIDLQGMKGVPRIMSGQVGSAIEKFVVSLISPNYKKLNEGLVSHLVRR
jgi:hypothetical protein